MRYLDLFLMAFSIDSVHCAFYFIPSSKERVKRSNGQVIPWIGILRVTLPDKRSDAVTGLILIAKQIAIASASDVAKIDKERVRKNTRALFYSTEGVQWECSVKDYILHPEFDVETTNTLAIVMLENNKEHPDFLWRPVSWLNEPNTKRLNIFAVGFTDERKMLDQMKIKMETVNKSACLQFYKQEKLDYKMFWPTYYWCFKAARSRRSCVYDAGMALAHWDSVSDEWTLLGVSTFGPGCSLPSRFIQVPPYKSWLGSHIQTRRQYTHPLPINASWTEEPYEDMDTMILSYLSNDTIVLRDDLAGINETVRGKCEEPIDGVLMYHDIGEFDAGSDFRTAVALYSISLSDIRYGGISCLLVNMNCTQRSDAILTFHKGFGQEDIEEMIQKIPKGKITSKQTLRPKIIHIHGKYIDSRLKQVTTLWFKFEFKGRAYLKVLFYGKTWADITSSTLSTSTASD